MINHAVDGLPQALIVNSAIKSGLAGGGSMGDAVKKRWRIEIDSRLCKGCSICVDFCPTDTLKMKGLCVDVFDLDRCTGCQLCDLRCPDFAIQVFPQ